MDSLNSKNIVLSLIPLRELVTFPSTVVPLLVGRRKSIESLKYAGDYSEGIIFLAVQENQLNENPNSKEVFKTGLVAKIEKEIRHETGNYRVMVKGLERARIIGSRALQLSQGAPTLIHIEDTFDFQPIKGIDS